MKKILYSSAVAVALIAASCSNEEPAAQNAADGTTTIQVTLPGAMKTRSIGDGTGAETLYYAIYDAESGELISKNKERFDDEEDPNCKIVNISLANGRAYKIAFFATTVGLDGESGYSWDPAKKTIDIDYDRLKAPKFDENGNKIADIFNYNNVDYDAFYGMYETDGVVTAPFKGEVTLNRILAQVNWGTSDYYDQTVQDIYHVYDAEKENLKTKVVFTNVYRTYDFWNKKVVGEPETVTFNYSSRPTVENAEWDWDRSTYQYLSVNYILVAEGPQVVDATLTSNDGEKDRSVVKVANLPVQTNYQTVIRGALLSSNGDLEVTKDPYFDGTKGPHDVFPGENDINNPTGDGE